MPEGEAVMSVIILRLERLALIALVNQHARDTTEPRPERCSSTPIDELSSYLVARVHP